MSGEDESVCPMCHGQGKISPKQAEDFKMMNEAVNKLADTVKAGVRS